MTHIVGLRRSGLNAIISDARISWKEHGRLEGQNTALKTGLLFPGCIFGRSGSDDHGRRFILEAKAQLTGRNTLPGFWKEFEQLASAYRFSMHSADHFRILLSCRWAGEAEFYILDSREGLSRVSDHSISLGSGKTLLDPLVDEQYVPQIEEISTALRDNNLPDRLFPYFMRLWLSELSQSFELSQLERVGVGGVFHFVYQTEHREGHQEPALYVSSAADRSTRTVYCWMYRVAFAKGGLVIDTLTPPGQIRGAQSGKHERVALFDTSARPDVTSVDAERLQREMLEEIKSQPWYLFCGFGFANPTERKGFGFHVTKERKYVVNQDGEIDPEYQELIASNFSLGQPNA